MNSKWAVVALLASLAVNLLLVGYLVGQTRSTGPAIDPSQAFPRWARQLPDDRRQHLRPVLRDHFQNVRPQLRSLRRQQQALYRAISAEPFDPDAVKIILGEMHAANGRLQASTHDTFVDFLSNLTPDERKQFAAMPMRPPHRRPGPHPDRGNHRQ